MDRPKFEEKYGFVPAFDQKRKKRVSLAPHLAKDPRYLEKMGFELIEKPEDVITKFTPQVESTATEFTGTFKDDQVDHTKSIYHREDMTLTVPIQEKPKRGRPKKQ